MMRWLVILVLLASPAMGQAVRVTSGEHGSFTRLVLQFPDAVDWQAGRTEDGYELRVPGAGRVYDLSDAFRLIGRERVASVRADPVTGTFRMGLGCACHILPFALRPDVVVIDVRDGPAPEGWGFEASLDGDPVVPLASRHTGPANLGGAGEGQPAPWDWRNIALGNRWSEAADDARPAPVRRAGPPLPVPANPELASMLADGFARAATQGLVDPVEKPPVSVSQPVLPVPMARISLGIGVDARPAPAAAPALSAEGALCPGNARLALQDWGDDRPIAEQLADATTSLAGEFDRAQPEALHRAIRFRLFLGFGAEALALMRAFGAPAAEDPLWPTLSRLVDGGADPEGAFAGLEGCDDPAALWATVADPGLSLGTVNKAALLRSFSALPAHLRLALGPALSERFLGAGDRTTSQALTDSVLRLPVSEDDRRATLMQVRRALDAKDAVAADRMLAPLLADPGLLAADVLISQVDLAVMTEAPAPHGLVTMIESLRREADATAAPALTRALVLAHALSGTFGAAFDLLPEARDATADLWRLLVDKGPDEAVLDRGLVLDEALKSDLPPDTRRNLAERLLELGFPDAAQFWGHDDPLIAARAALALERPGQVLQLLGKADGPVAQKLKAEALLKIDADAATTAFAALGDEETAAKAARLAQAWPELAAGGPAEWRAVAESLSQADAPATGLARSRALALNAGKTGAAVSALLETVPRPDGY